MKKNILKKMCKYKCSNYNNFNKIEKKNFIGLIKTREGEGGRYITFCAYLKKIFLPKLLSHRFSMSRN